MASAESSGLMSEKKNSASSSKSENLVPPEFDDCACPRARSLATEIYRPHVPGYFALKNHLITRSIFEFEMGHITRIYSLVTLRRSWEMKTILLRSKKI